MGLWFFLIYVPLHNRIAQVEIHATESQRQLDDFKACVNDIPRFLDARESLRIQKAEMSSRLYSKGDILKLLDGLQQQAQKENLTITEIIPPIEELLWLNSVVPDSGQLQTLNLSLKLEGAYVSFGKFVSSVEQSSYFRKINTCAITSGKETHGKLQLELGFTALLGNFEGSA
jgi:Tfp pilus assembly protein PilO